MGKQDDIVKLYITIDLEINLILERTASELRIDEDTAIKVAIEREGWSATGLGGLMKWLLTLRC